MLTQKKAKGIGLQGYTKIVVCPDGSVEGRIYHDRPSTDGEEVWAQEGYEVCMQADKLNTIRDILDELGLLPREIRAIEETTADRLLEISREGDN